MPFPSIDVAFVKQYEAEVHEAYQRRGSKLRGTVRTKNGIVGASTFFPKVGTGVATTKARNAAVAAMNVAHTTVECILEDWYAGDWVDKLDELKTNIDERGVIANAGAWALGRKTDELIIAQLDAAPSGRNVTGTGNLANTAGFTKDKALRAVTMLNEGDVPDDGMRFCAVSPKAWEDLMKIDEFVRSDYIGSDLPFRQSMGNMARSWLGVNWIMHTGLPTAAGPLRENFMWHQNAVGHAIGAEVSADVTWHGDRASHFVNHMMSQGAKLIDDLGVVRVLITE